MKIFYCGIKNLLINICILHENQHICSQKITFLQTLRDSHDCLLQFQQSLLNLTHLPPVVVPQPMLNILKSIFVSDNLSHPPHPQMLSARKTDLSHLPTTPAINRHHNLPPLPPKLIHIPHRKRTPTRHPHPTRIVSLPAPATPTPISYSLHQISQKQSSVKIAQKMDYNDISLQWMTQNQDLKEMGAPIEQVDFQLERINRCTNTQFKLLSFMTQTQQHVNKLYKHPEQFPLNRHSTYMAFEPTRVKLAPEDTVQNYINANMIKIKQKKVIATQGPLTVTVSNFWRMVEQYQVQSIYMLCKLIEKGQIKCDRYFPEGKDHNDMLKQKEFTVRLVEDKVHPQFQNILIRQIELKNHEKNTVRMVTHYQITNWADKTAPKESPGLKFLVQKLTQDLNANSIPIVHCSAGVGRTGTLIAMANLKMMIQNGQPISIFNQIRKIRQQRWGMIYNSQQYQYLYDYAEHEIVKLQNGILSANSQYSSDQDENAAK